MSFYCWALILLGPGIHVCKSSLALSLEYLSPWWVQFTSETEFCCSSAEEFGCLLHKSKNSRGRVSWLWSIFPAYRHTVIYWLLKQISVSAPYYDTSRGNSYPVPPPTEDPREQREGSRRQYSLSTPLLEGWFLLQMWAASLLSSRNCGKQKLLDCRWSSLWPRVWLRATAILCHLQPHFPPFRLQSTGAENMNQNILERNKTFKTAHHFQRCDAILYCSAPSCLQHESSLFSTCPANPMC